MGTADDARAYRFAVRQLEWALTQRDPLPVSDHAVRARRWLLASLVLGIGVLVGTGVVSATGPERGGIRSDVGVETGSNTTDVSQTPTPPGSVVDVRLGPEPGATGTLSTTG